MDIFENKIQPFKFRSMNFIWNNLTLNSPWSVGYVSTLIESQTFKTKEEWKAFYYKSGEERLRKIEERCTPTQKALLLDHTKSYNQLPKELRDLNFLYGRTEKELNEKGRYMYNEIVKEGNPFVLTLAECIYAVKYRVMGETWNGIVARERNTVLTLGRLFPELQFDKVDGELDYKYGIDYEIYDEKDLLCAIQIKPLSYEKGNSPAIQKAKKANEKKNAEYEKRYQSNVLYVYSNSKGQILNEDVTKSIHAKKAQKEKNFCDLF